MLRLYSKGCEYALRGLTQCAADGGVRGFQDLCKKARIPEHFTRKMFQKLARKGLLVSAPGPNGGFRLALSAEKINLRQLIEAIDGADAFSACVMGRSACRSDIPCALHETWVAAKDRLLPDLEAMTLASLMQRGGGGRRLVRKSARRRP